MLSKLQTQYENLKNSAEEVKNTTSERSLKIKEFEYFTGALMAENKSDKVKKINGSVNK